MVFYFRILSKEGSADIKAVAARAERLTDAVNEAISIIKADASVGSVSIYVLPHLDERESVESDLSLGSVWRYEEDEFHVDLYLKSGWRL